MIISTEEAVDTVDDIPSVLCPDITNKCLLFAKKWTVDTFSNAVTKWNRACDKKADNIDQMHSLYCGTQTVLSRW